MATVLFVHGTGVRQPSYVQTYAILKEAFEHYGIPHDLQPCLWGDDLGSRPLQGSAQKPPSLTSEQDIARWDLLYRDPLFELRLLKRRPKQGPPLPPSAPRPDIALWGRISAYVPTDDVKAFLRRWKLEDYWADAWKMIIGEDETAKTVLHNSPQEIGEPGQAVARAVVAALLMLAIADERSIPHAARRDELVNVLVADWKAQVAGIGNYLAGWMADLVATAATPIIRWKRAEINEAASPASGDILLYQARGKRIQEFIKKTAEEAGDEVILLAHSLGGIACVDLLALNRIACVKYLITAGSQSPLLYQIGALTSLDSVQGETLRSDFPKWLNFHDPYDFLSYPAKDAFGLPQIRDVQVESGQPFPHSHGAYWTNAATWQAIGEFLA